MDNDNKEEENETHAEFILNEFDGVEDAADRSAVADFGLPMDIGDISPAPLEEFEASGETKTRAVGALDFRPNVSQVTETEFDVGASFQASHSLFAPSVQLKQAGSVEAPLLPFYLKPAKTSFRSDKSVGVLMSELERTFELFSINYTVENKSPCTYGCSALLHLAFVEFEVRVFKVESEHLVECRHLSGCRYSFGEIFKSLSEPFVAVSEVVVPMKLAPPPVCDDDFLAMPTLASSPSSVLVDHEMGMLSDSAGLGSNMQAARAVGSSEDSSMFSDDGFGIPLALRLTELASPKTDSDEMRSVAMGAIANLSAMENVSLDWLDGATDAVIAGVEDEHPHVKREALRTVENMSKRNNSLAAKFVRAGVVPTLELEANGGAEDQVLDVPAQKFAQGALSACRA